MNNADMPAIPLNVAIGLSDDIVSSADLEGGAGLTKREYFAGLAMQALIANPNSNWFGSEMALLAVGKADFLLKELDK